LERLINLLYGADAYSDYEKNYNAINAPDDYIMAKIYFETDLDNVYFRKDSVFEPFTP
jgi:hypothetical protein